MYKLPKRCVALREEAVNKKENMKHYWAQRTVYCALGEAEAHKKGMSKAEVAASGLSCLMENFTPFIAPGELIVGFNFGDAQYASAASIHTDPNVRDILKENGVPEELTEDFLEARKNGFGQIDYFDFGRDVERTQQEVWMGEEWACTAWCAAYNHSVIGYEKVLKLGFEGLLKEVEHYEAQNGSNMLYEGAKMICRAACGIGEKYARAAEEKMGDPAYDPEDLKVIMETCRRVPRYPAGNFREAVQALLFAHYINTWEDDINANSLGHLDQILYPYYQADIANGSLTREEAFEIICCLWLKLYRDYDVQQSCLGGTTPDGRSLVNDLSYLMLDATEQLDFVRCMSVRFSEKTEPEFLKRALEVVGHNKKGIPFFFNDDVLIPALISKGIAREDAYNYAQIGCVETVIPGKSNPHAYTGHANFLKTMEYVLCNGDSMMFPEKSPGVKTGTLDQFTTFEDFYAAVLCQMEEILDVTCGIVRKQLDAAYHNVPMSYKSLLTEGCLQSGKDYNDRGAKYDYYQITFNGVPNLADSLMVIRKLVYEEKKYTLQQLKEILVQDYPDESVRQEFINKVPKYGNDIDEVDRIAADIIDKGCDILEKMSEKYGISYHAQPFTFVAMVDQGKLAAASPDGRHKGEILAYSLSPMQGRDANGLTALLNSISKLPSKRTPGTISAIVEVDPKLFCDENIDLLTDILIASGKKGLSNVQFNTVDAETLCEAQKYPEKYNNLAVRVSGFSQKFNLLSLDLQNHIIGRTKHASL